MFTPRIVIPVFYGGFFMAEKDMHVRVMHYLNKNMNLLKFLCVIKECEKEILGLNFEVFLEGSFKMPSYREIESMVTKKISVEFNVNDFFDNGPFDFTDTCTKKKNKLLETGKAIFEKFTQAQAQAITMAIQDSINVKVTILNKDFKKQNNQMLHTKIAMLRHKEFIFSPN
jgi:hypothetical protein